MNERELKKIFTAHKADLPDAGFTRRTVDCLPDRPALLPQWLTGGCIAAAVASLWLVFTTTPVAEQLRQLIDSLSRLEAPSTGSVAVCVGILALIGAIGYSVVEVTTD